MDKGEFTVTIKRATMVMTMDRTDLVQVDPTPDGVAFSFKHGVHIVLTDQFLPLEAKELIRAANSFPRGNIVFDLNNYKKPAYIHM
jgi:hypothetical protein